MATTPKSKSKTELTCPECGRTFTRPQALGAHRFQAHGIAGASHNAQTRKSATRTRRTQTAAKRTKTAAGPRAATANGSRRIDRDALLATLFPAGIPPREDVITAANNWLNEAERLARIR